MFTSANWRAILLVFLLVFAPIAAWSHAKDTWAYQNPGEDYYFDGFDTAAIMQSDGTVAVLAFPKGGNTMNAHIGFFAQEIISSIKSTLIDADGTTRSVVVEGEYLKHSELNENGFISYHYVLSENDMPLFQHASIWQIETPDQTITYSLKGSRAALDKVLAEQARQDAETQQE